MTAPEPMATPAGRIDIPLSVRPDKVQPWHLERLALVYVRQSSPQQVVEHKESAARQYGLVHRADASRGGLFQPRCRTVPGVPAHRPGATSPDAVPMRGTPGTVRRVREPSASQVV